MIVGAVTALLIPAITGYLVITAILREDSGFLERASLAYPVGAGLLTIFMFNIGLLRIPFGIPVILLPISAVTLFVIYFIKKQGIKPFNAQPDGINTFLQEKPFRKILILLLFIWIIYKVFAIFSVTITLPIWSWDSWEIWSARAFNFYHDKGLCLQSEDFFAESVKGYIYPPHNPLLQVWSAMLMGTFDRVLVKLWVPVYLVSAAIFFYASTRRHLGQPGSSAVVLIFLSSPVLMIHATEPYSDMLLGVYLLFAIAAFWRLISGSTINSDAALAEGESPKRRYAVLCGIFSAEALFVKNEAMIFIGSLTAVFFVWFFKERIYRRSRHLPAYYIAPLILLILPFLVFKLYYGIGFGQGVGITHHFEFKYIALTAIAKNFWLTIDNFNFILPAIAGLLLFMLIFRTKKPVINYLMLPVSLYILFFIAIYIFSDKDFLFLLEGSIFFRNFLTYYPALFFTALLIFIMIFKEIHKGSETGINE